jgi:hypothetical protein
VSEIETIREGIEFSWANRAALHAALDALEARLKAAEQALPETFYAHLPLAQRVEAMVSAWQRALPLLDAAEQALRDCRSFAGSVRKHVPDYENSAQGLISRLDATLARHPSREQVVPCDQHDVGHQAGWA